MLNLKGFLEKKDNEIVGIASTQMPDRDGEVILQEGWDLTNFKMNPVLLASHNYHEFPIGKVTDIMVENNQLIFKAIFSEATQAAKEAYALVKEGILSTFSVGFIPREYDASGAVISKAELLEISLVSVPANAQAVVLAKSFKDNDLATKLIKEWLKNDMLKKEVEELEKEEEKVEEGSVVEEEKKEEVEEVLPQEVEVTEGKMIECECGKKYILKLASQSVEEKREEEGEGRSIEEANIQLLKKTVGSLQLLLSGLNRKEDRK